MQPTFKVLAASARAVLRAKTAAAELNTNVRRERSDRADMTVNLEEEEVAWDRF
jgi:hypothetical protein